MFVFRDASRGFGRVDNISRHGSYEEASVAARRWLTDHRYTLGLFEQVSEHEAAVFAYRGLEPFIGEVVETG